MLVDYELEGLWDRQCNISRRNQTRLKELSLHADPHIAERARLLLEVAQVRSHRRKRLYHLARADRSDLIRRLEEHGFVLPRKPVEDEDDDDDDDDDDREWILDEERDPYPLSPYGPSPEYTPLGRGEPGWGDEIPF